MSTQSPHSVLRREDSDNDNLGTISDTSSNDWPAVIYTLAEQFGMDSDPLKCHFVRELYSAGFDNVAKEVLKDLLVNFTSLIILPLFTCDPKSSILMMSLHCL